MIMSLQKNVLGTPLRTCSRNPLTGFFRNGCCETDAEDAGEHTACVQVTEEFLQMSQKLGNDLITPHPQYGFAGLKPGDSWCVCAGRWLEVYKAGVVGPLHLEATHESLLDYISLEELSKCAVKKA